MTLTPGTRLGPSDIIVLLGEGGMGEAYRTHDPGLGRDVAIKILHRDLKPANVMVAAAAGSLVRSPGDVLAPSSPRRW